MQCLKIYFLDNTWVQGHHWKSEITTVKPLDVMYKYPRYYRTHTVNINFNRESNDMLFLTSSVLLEIYFKLR